MPNKSRPPPIRTHLLAALPCEDYARLLPSLESVLPPFKRVRYEGGEPSYTFTCLDRNLNEACLSLKTMSKEEALKTARRLVREAVDAAGRAGIDPALVVAPHCPETSPAQDDDSRNLTWGGTPVIIDNSTQGLFEMPEPDDDPGQKPAFLVTQSTADLVRQDFERYQPSLERMAEDWVEKKERVLSEAKVEKESTAS